jgi:hypothetical protein
VLDKKREPVKSGLKAALTEQHQPGDVLLSGNYSLSGLGSQFI